MFFWCSFDFCSTYCVILSKMIFHYFNNECVNFSFAKKSHQSWEWYLMIIIANKFYIKKHFLVYPWFITFCWKPPQGSYHRPFFSIWGRVMCQLDIFRCDSISEQLVLSVSRPVSQWGDNFRFAIYILKPCQPCRGRFGKSPHFLRDFFLWNLP